MVKLELLEYKHGKLGTKTLERRKAQIDLGRVYTIDLVDDEGNNLELSLSGVELKNLLKGRG